MINVRNLVKNYNGFCAVNNISFSVPQGAIFAFLGPNGAGKTTTIKMLTTILNPSSGSIQIGGFDPIQEPLAVRRLFGIVFQDPSLDEELTGFENMQLHCVLYGIPRRLHKDKIKKLLTFLELWDRKDDYIKHYSGGMKRRLEIARAFLHDPSILILDEPTLGLDPQTRNHIWTHIKEINSEFKVTILFTTHYMEEAEKMATEIAIIDNGKIIAQGNAQDLKATTKTNSLEEAFIALTGHIIRDENASGLDNMRIRKKLWKR